MPQPRLGPRPLPLHLGTALMTWASSESAWQLWKNGSPSSNPASAAPEGVAAVLKEVTALETHAVTAQLEQALHREIGRRMDRLAEGVLAYRRHPVHRNLGRRRPPGGKAARACSITAAPTPTRASAAACLLVIPSLINRWGSATSPRKTCCAPWRPGLQPYLVDWGAPDAERRKFDLTAYVARLERAAGFVDKRARRAPAVMGYCMGGTLAVALAARQPRRVAKLALLAAPWDFMPTRPAMPSCCRWARCSQNGRRVGELPVDMLRTLFWSLDPWLAVKKFGRFLGMDPTGDSARDFVLLEDWLNEVPLAGPAARDCLIGWYGDNLPGHRPVEWSAAGRIVPRRSPSRRW